MSMATTLRKVDNLLEHRSLQDISIVSAGQVGLDAPVNCFYEGVKQKDLFDQTAVGITASAHPTVSIVVNSSSVGCTRCIDFGGWRWVCNREDDDSICNRYSKV